VVFLLDVDNTLLDNDRVTAELESYLRRESSVWSGSHSASVWARTARTSRKKPCRKVTEVPAAVQG
ncbi:MAG: hypothetical protein M3403_06550, partial [Gemmatimonadota bacterium]|nr:hypothetical protein [Gemmatimonadota bacterium]